MRSSTTLLAARPVTPTDRLARRVRRARLRVRLAVADVGPVVRRSLDVLAVSCALLLLLPLLSVVALLVKFTSAGPTFFRQERIGLNGRRFSMWKFRTMVANADELKAKLEQQGASTDGLRFKMVRDPRITPVGRLLRTYSIDELPQLWNVLRGDMTLVGPRPPVWREVRRYDVRALRRLEVKPGLTCLWQVQGRADLSFDQQVSLDIEYIDLVNPLQELRILQRTVPAVLSGRGAY